MSQGFARLRTQNNSHVLVNPDDVVRVTIDDAYRPGGFCTVHLRDGTKVRCWESINEVELLLNGAR